MQREGNSKKRIWQLRGKGYLNSDSTKSEAEDSPDPTDSFSSHNFTRKRLGLREREGNSNPIQPGEFRGNWARELTRAILNFGEAFERVESSKLQQVVEMEKQRMKFAKELELQRMQFFMKTQMEFAQLKHGKNVGNIHYNTNQ
ncbi:hypothetical protein HHK36_025369 [Tetracentron sinense]|uniref:Trihelix transcription factor ASIL2 n=1 Tax=Tetracentron sinense TaxID=13715 RepID=A0A834YHF4_TETSI|nr:hypothetical protein HHK36_025369 [Tetracentron sinense]